MVHFGFLTRLFGSTPAHNPAAPRVFAYCASNIGAGPLLRLTRILGEAKRQRPAVSIFLATDAAETAAVGNAGAALLRLPKFVFSDDAGSREHPLHLRLRNRELAQLRARVLLAAAKAFAPDLIVADTNPHGKRDELLPLLRWARRTRTRVLLLMRDIPAAPDEVFKLRGAAARVQKHAAYYTRIGLAGDAAFFDAAQAYAWPTPLREKISYLGFVVPAVAARPRAEALAAWPELDAARPLVVASCGGGWQPAALVPALLGALGRTRAARPQLQLLLLTGPAVNHEHLQAWRAEAAGLGGVVIERFSGQFAAALRQAELVICQAGSTAFQVLEGAQPVVLLTRPFKTSEQSERAARLAGLPGLRVETAAPTVEEIEAWFAWGLGQTHAARQTGFHYDGVQRGSELVLEMLDAK